MKAVAIPMGFGLYTGILAFLDPWRSLPRPQTTNITSIGSHCRFTGIETIALVNQSALNRMMVEKINMWVYFAVVLPLYVCVLPRNAANGISP